MPGGRSGGQGRGRGAGRGNGRGRGANSSAGQPAKAPANGAGANNGTLGTGDKAGGAPRSASLPSGAQPAGDKQQEQPQHPVVGVVKKKKLLTRELQALQQPLLVKWPDARGQRPHEREGQRRQAAEGQPAAKRVRLNPSLSPAQRGKAAGGRQAETAQGGPPEEQPKKKRKKQKAGRTAEVQQEEGQAGAAPPATTGPTPQYPAEVQQEEGQAGAAPPAGAGAAPQHPAALQQSAPQPAAWHVGEAAAGADTQADAAGSSQPGAADRGEPAGQAEAGVEAGDVLQAREEGSHRQSGTLAGDAPPGEDSRLPPALAPAPAPAMADGQPPEGPGIKAEDAAEPEHAGAPAQQPPPAQVPQQAGRQQAARPAGALLPAALAEGPFAAHLGAVAGVLRHRPGRVLAAAMLLHGALAAREPAGPGSGHDLAWRITASFLRAVLPPAGVQRLAGSARGYAAVAAAAAAAAARSEQAERASEQQVQKQPSAVQQRQQQQQQAPAGGPSPRQPDSRAQPAAYPRPGGEPGGHGLVGAAKRKASKPRSTHETLGLPAAAAAAGSSGGRRGGSEPPSAGRALRRRVRQPERLEAQLGPRKSHNPAPAAAGRGGGGGGGARQGRAGLPLCDIPLPQEPLPRWGVQRARSARAATLGLPGLEGEPEGGACSWRCFQAARSCSSTARCAATAGPRFC